VPSMPVSIRSTYTTRLASSKADLHRVKKTLVSERQHGRDVDALSRHGHPSVQRVQRDLQRESQRSELLSGGPGLNPSIQDDPYSDGQDQRTRLLAGTETLADGR
jgi:vesicle transport through interaction with t-SNAREs protein 1